MNKFFVPNEVYKERIAICKSCEYYFTPTGNCKDCGCFMKIKARLAPAACGKKKWSKTTKTETPKILPPEIIEEVVNIWEDIKTGRAKNHEAKGKVIQIYNTIHNTKYSKGTNCRSCLSTCFDAIKNIYNEHKK